MTRRSFQINKSEMNNLLKGRSGEVGKMMGGFAGLATQQAREVARERITTRTGRYVNSIASTTEQSSAGTRVVTTARAPYSQILETGSRPHTIVPRSAQTLRFTVGGTVVFAKRVNHPGTKPYNILSVAIRRAGRQLHRLARR